MQYLTVNPFLFYELLLLICLHLTNNSGDIHVYLQVLY